MARGWEVNSRKEEARGCVFCSSQVFASTWLQVRQTCFISCEQTPTDTDTEQPTTGRKPSLLQPRLLYSYTDITHSQSKGCWALVLRFKGRHDGAGFSRASCAPLHHRDLIPQASEGIPVLCSRKQKSWEVMVSGLRTTAAEFQLCLILAVRPQTPCGPSPPQTCLVWESPLRRLQPIPECSARTEARGGSPGPSPPGPSLRSTLPPTGRPPSSSRPSPALGSLPFPLRPLEWAVKARAR